jgi:hypothetical protein
VKTGQNKSNFASKKANDFFLEAMNFEINGDSSSAETLYLKTVEINPKHGNALLMLALIKYEANEQNLALKYANDAIKANHISSQLLELKGNH